MATAIVDAATTHEKISTILLVMFVILVMFAIIYVLGFYAYDYDVYLKH